MHFVIFSKEIKSLLCRFSIWPRRPVKVVAGTRKKRHNKTHFQIDLSRLSLSLIKSLSCHSIKAIKFNILVVHYPFKFLFEVVVDERR